MIVFACISRNGKTTLMPGDLTSSSAVVSVGTRGTEIEIIDTVK
ncbi:MAG: hypothetical protein ACKVP2_11995 [Burkholderiales bacterium]